MLAVKVRQSITNSGCRLSLKACLKQYCRWVSHPALENSVGALEVSSAPAARERACMSGEWE